MPDSALPEVTVGTVGHNADTGQRVVWNGTEWVPVWMDTRKIDPSGGWCAPMQPHYDLEPGDARPLIDALLRGGPTPDAVADLMAVVMEEVPVAQDTYRCLGGPHDEIQVPAGPDGEPLEAVEWEGELYERVRSTSGGEWVYVRVAG